MAQPFNEEVFFNNGSQTYGNAFISGDLTVDGTIRGGIIETSPGEAFSGTLTGNITGNATGLSGTPNINIGFTTITGVGNTALVVNGNARITGILTIGTSSITLNGVENKITGVTSIFDSSGGYLSHPPGTLIFHCGSSAPSGYIKANGATISRTTYAALFNALGTTYGAGDGSTTFKVPDMRGEFPRGWDDGRGVDSGRSFGSSQAEMINQHKHWISSMATDDRNITGTGANGQEYGLVADAGSYSADDPNKTTGRFTRNDPGYLSNNETRPRNIALLACIKY